MNNLQIKQDFPFLRNNNVAYLDSAATSHKPEAVISAISNFYSTNYGPVHRGIYASAEHATQLYEDARKAVADFINATPEEIVFTSGATDSINMVAYAWAMRNLRAGDEIVLPVSEHHSNLLIWQELATVHGFKVVYVNVTPDFKLDLADFLQKITPKTKLVTFAISSHIFGNYPHNYITKIIAQAHAVGAAVLLDAAQAVGHEQIDVQLLQADFLAFSAHKMFGPTGVGILYVNKKIFKQLGVNRIGGGMVHSAQLNCIAYKEMPYRLEAGTPPSAQAVGLHAAIIYFKEKINYTKLAEHENILIEYLIMRLRKHSDIVIMQAAYSEPVHNHLVSFYSKKFHAHDIAAWLSQYNVAVRAGHHCAQPIHEQLGVTASVRVSVHAYTTHDDMVACADALDKLYI